LSFSTTNRWSHEPDYGDSVYTNWKTEIPYISSELDNCGVMTADGTWFNFKCTDDRDYVCETNLGPALTQEPTPAPTFLRTEHPTRTHHHHPTNAPTPIPVILTTAAPTTPSAASGGGGGNQQANPSDAHNVAVNVHMSYVFVAIVSLILLVVFFRLRPKLLPGSKETKSEQHRIDDDFDGVNSTHNLVEMQTRKSCGEDDVARDTSEEVDLGGCFAFSNSSAEEMLASQLNGKVYSSVEDDDLS
jgi:hypothetical protein